MDLTILSLPVFSFGWPDQDSCWTSSMKWHLIKRDVSPFQLISAKRFELAFQGGFSEQRELRKEAFFRMDH